MKLAKNPIFSSQFQHIYKDFVICFEIYISYFLAAEND